MKKHFAFIVLALSAMVCLSDQVAPKRPKLTPEERAERRLRRTGGEVMKPISSTCVEIVNVSEAVPAAFVDSAIKNIQESLTYPFRQVAAPSKDGLVGMTITIVNESGNGDVLSIYPERPGATINVAPLKSDKPDEAVLEKRVVKEVWRAFAYALGAGNATQFQSVLKPILGVRDLDGNKADFAAPDAFNQIIAMADKIGLKRKEVYTYRQACIEGWAPPPVNDYQRAIYEKIKAEQAEVPTNGMEIKFDRKTGK